MPNHLAFFVFFVFVTLVPACEGNDTPTSEAPTAPAVQDEAPAVDEPAADLTGASMREHFVRIREIRQALIADDVDAALESMAHVADDDPAVDALSPSQRAMLDAMRAEAGRFAEVDDLPEATQALARVLVHCGACHEAADGGPTFATPPLPQGETPQIEMSRHRWGVDRMWEGIVARDHEAYAAGAEVLAEARLRTPGAEEADGVDGAIDRVHEEAAAALETQEWGARAAHFGRILSTCAGCHRAMGVGDQAGAAVDAERPVGP